MNSRPPVLCSVEKDLGAILARHHTTYLIVERKWTIVHLFPIYFPAVKKPSPVENSSTISRVKNPFFENATIGYKWTTVHLLRHHPHVRSIKTEPMYRLTI
jgi:hypothetical protein